MDTMYAYKIILLVYRDNDPGVEVNDERSSFQLKITWIRILQWKKSLEDEPFIMGPLDECSSKNYDFLTSRGKWHLFEMAWFL